ncbi:MAG: glycosyl hydrolase [Opitutales bacterium]
MRSSLLLLLAALGSGPLLSPLSLSAATVPVGAGSYTTTFPGTDVAGRNGVPGGAPQLSGAAVGRPVPTNDWWSALLNNNHAGNLFNYPLAMGTLPSALDIGYLVPVSGVNGSSEPRDPFDTIVVGVSGLQATRATVADYSDWTVTMAWESGDHAFRATSGIGMPFVYFSKGSADTAVVTVSEGTPTIAGEILLITNSQGGANFAVYAPVGSTWVASGSTFTSTLAGKDYWSLAILPAGTPATIAADWQPYAYVEPVDTAVSWSYDAASAVLRTEFTTTTAVHEGTGTTVLQGLLPHQWAHLAPDAPALEGSSLSSIRGELKLLAANHFATERTFHGILPTLPARGVDSPGFDPAKLHGKVSALAGDSLATWTDSYNEGQVMNRLIQTARIAHETGDFSARDKILATIQERLEDWLTYETGEVAFLFHYSSTWSALLGYPSGHGQDTNLNDHHFHWGYFIHAAAFLEQFQPGWADEWGGMVDLLIRDAASPDRDDPLFPFLRSFSPFAGHSWANGFATFPFGNDQESSSESMQFASALIHWGAVTDDEAIRDLGIYLYTTEQTAIEEYWFDIHERTFKPGYGYALASRIWGNGYDNQTFWTGDIAAAYGIELYPIHGGSLYLGHIRAYAEELWTEMAANTGILNQAVNPNLWHDIYWQFLAFIDPAAAIALYDANPGRELKFGVSDAQTYYWLHAMNALGRVEATITADDPLAAVFDRDGTKTYVAHNHGETPRLVTFSDGATLEVPPRSLATSADLPFAGSLATPFAVAPVGGRVPLTVNLEGDTSGLTGVELYDGTTLLGTLAEAPAVFLTEGLGAGRHTFYARFLAGNEVALSEFVTVVVGEQMPFGGLPLALPGTFEAAAYDRFEGGNGQDIAYRDNSPGNNGGYRPFEDVDASEVSGEGATVGWLDAGEWLEYTVQVAEAGRYDLSLRYASGNAAGGGPFYFEVDGRRASADFPVASTGNWNTFATEVFEGIALPAGQHVLRLRVVGGEFNLGRLTFSRTGPLGFTPPVADAGADLIVAPTLASASLDASASTVVDGGSLSYAWEQVFGPAVATIATPGSAASAVSGLTQEGLYRFRVTVDDGSRRDEDSMEVLVGALSARPPSTALFNPSDGDQVIAGRPLTVSAVASDTDGTIERVDLFNGAIHLGTRFAEPYTFAWSPPIGAHVLTVRALDSDGLSTTSTAVGITANAPTPCRTASASGDFEVEFSADTENPTVTFIPSRAGVGSSIVIFYLNLGGVIIEPNVPYRFTAAAGETLSYYFTYSVPEGGERNTLGENATFTVGACAEPAESDPGLAWIAWLEAHFSPAELADSTLEAALWGEGADPEGDGLSNALEFLTGGDPWTPSSPPLAWMIDGLGSAHTVRYARRASLPADYGQLQWSRDLVQWSDGGISPRAVSLEDGIEVLEATLPAGELDGDAPVFLRLLFQE